ncbi:M48 family metallopeptidase [Acidisoma cladoniae]|uniref:M48 family metallopeptidase n=1 Tax=Acidisoma cladoniae TaxID=3040935 RepID=UPI00254F0E7D|nr:M48 family metallopeptidase [Acidisoma sp. PAMC 29798]
MAKKLPQNLRYPRENFYGTLLSIFGVILWVALVAVMVNVFYSNPRIFFLYCLYVVAFALFAFLSALFFRAYIYGHYVLIGPTQFPHLHEAVVDGAARLGLTPVPVTFVYNSNGLLNAFARRLFGKRFVFLTSALIEVETDAQIRFVIGHELGHHAAGHLNPYKNLMRLPGHFVPFLGRAYSRRRELTCDRVGAYLSEDLQACRSALNMLACGCQRLNASLNCDAFEAQERLVPGFTGWLTLIFSRYPRTTRRVIEISKFFAQRPPLRGA